MDRIDNTSLDLEKQNIEKIKELFPAAVEEGKINFDMLRALLGDEVDDSKEKYQFTWNGKSKAIKLAQTPSSATLIPCKEKSKDWDTTENLYIEGDNLEVLKQLQKTYYGKIKMIYIDPPYNTGKDFVYHDDFKNSIENYKKQTNQLSSSNPENAGRFHTRWLNLIYPRLILARNLLSSDGIIFISIDDHEQENLKKMCDEVFGETNYIGTLIRKVMEGGKSDSKGLAIEQEYCHVYGKNGSNGLYKKTSEHQDHYNKKDDHFNERGYYYLKPLENGGLGYVPSLDYPIEGPNGEDIYPGDYHGDNGYRWVWGKEKFERAKELDMIVFTPSQKDKSKFKVYYKIYENVDTDGNLSVKELPYPSLFLDGYTNRQAVNDLKKIFNNERMFNYPKPISFLSELINMATRSGDIILDFFSGSSGTAQAVMQVSSEDNLNRKFIMVQFPELIPEKEPAYKAGFRNICEIGEERIRRAGEQIKAEWKKEHPSDTLFSNEEEFTTDIGFKVFKLDSSNVNEWDSSLELTEKELAERLGEVFKTDRSKEDILYEIMLKYGVFDRQVEEINVNGKTMYRVGKRYMIVCLEDNIDSSDIKAICELLPKTVIFKESGFTDDNAKLNAVYNLEKAGVEDVKCI